MPLALERFLALDGYRQMSVIGHSNVCRRGFRFHRRLSLSLKISTVARRYLAARGTWGVVFILNVTDSAAALDMLEKLPLGQAHLMSFELIPIPLNQLRQLQGMKANP